MATINGGQFGQASTSNASAFDGGSVTFDQIFKDSNGNAITSRALWVSSAGDISCVMESGNTVIWPGVPVGWFQVRCTKVTASGTVPSAASLRWAI